jgi:sorbitol-6-phosphate 2-dehydrogenase
MHLVQVDALVNNAGINVPRLLVDPAGKEELTEDIWDKVFAVNVKRPIPVRPGCCKSDVETSRWRSSYQYVL